MVSKCVFKTRKENLERRFYCRNGGFGMTEQETIEELKYDYNKLGKSIPCDTGWGVSIDEAYSMAISALEEIQEYRALGTVEELAEIQNTYFVLDQRVRKYEKLGTLKELREAIEKQKPTQATKNEVYSQACPKCGYPVKWHFCANCGQAIG